MFTVTHVNPIVKNRMTLPSPLEWKCGAFLTIGACGAENLYIPLLLQVSVQPPPNIPGRCSPPTAWTQQTPRWAAECGWRDSSCLKQYTSGSFWVLSQRAGAYFSRLRGGGRHLCMRNDSPGWPPKNCVYVQGHEAHHQALSSEKQDRWEGSRHIFKTVHKICKLSPETVSGSASQKGAK